MLLWDTGIYALLYEIQEYMRCWDTEMYGFYGIYKDLNLCQPTGIYALIGERSEISNLFFVQNTNSGRCWSRLEIDQTDIKSMYSLPHGSLWAVVPACTARLMHARLMRGTACRNADFYRLAIMPQCNKHQIGPRALKPWWQAAAAGAEAPLPSTAARGWHSLKQK